MVLKKVQFFVLCTHSFWSGTALSLSSHSKSRDLEIRGVAYPPGIARSFIADSNKGQPADPAYHGSRKIAKKRLVGPCKLCKPWENFETAQEKLDHLLQVHKIEHKCTICEKRFDRATSLKEHQQNAYGCGSKLRDQLNIEDQAAREAKKKAEENTSHCPYDQRPRNLKPFKSKISRNQHIKKQHRQVARCPGCGQRLIRQGDEENHHQCQGPSTSGRIVIPSVLDKQNEKEAPQKPQQEILEDTSKWQSIPSDDLESVALSTLLPDEIEQLIQSLFPLH